jgi:hypothetical protein
VLIVTIVGRVLIAIVVLHYSIEGLLQYVKSGQAKVTAEQASAACSFLHQDCYQIYFYESNPLRVRVCALVLD